ncbi:hypothetical protein D9M68_533810 [compost metagenome]
MEEMNPIFWNISNFDESKVPEFVRSAYLRNLPYFTEFLVGKHPHRKGAVCPFVPRAILDDAIYFTYFEGGDVDRCSPLIRRCIAFYKNAYKGKFGAVVIIFRDDINMHDLFRVHVENKEICVRASLMLGVLYKESSAASLHNNDYFPLRTPTPVLVIRDLVVSDLMFLDPAHYSLSKRCVFLDAFIRRFSGESESSFVAKQVEAARRLRHEYSLRVFGVRLAIFFSVLLVFAAVLWL